MPPKRDLLNQRFGKLVAYREGASDGNRRRWWCLCDCGNKTIVTTNNLVNGQTKSCGCLFPRTDFKVEKQKSLRRFHGNLEFATKFRR